MSKQIVNTEPTGQNSGCEDTDRRTTTCAESTDAQKDVLVPDGGSVVDQSAKKSSPHTDSYKVYPSRLRTGLVAIGSLSFTIAIVYLLGNGLVDSWLRTLVLYVGIPLSAIGFIFMSYITIKHNPVVEISGEGIRYSRPLRSDQMYSWKNIEKVSRAEQDLSPKTMTYVMIHLNEFPGEGGSPDSVRDDMDTVPVKDDNEIVLIPIDSYGIDFDEIAEKITEYSNVQVLTEIPSGA